MQLSKQGYGSTCWLSSLPTKTGTAAYSVSKNNWNHSRVDFESVSDINSNTHLDSISICDLTGKAHLFYLCCTPSWLQGLKNRRPFKMYYHTTKTIFGKDQRMPATGYISYPTLSASLTHCIRQWVRIFMSMHAYHRAFYPSRADTLMYFPRNRDGFEHVEQVVLLVFVLTFSTLCRIKIISFCSLKTAR